MHAAVTVQGIDVIVDLSGLIDIGAEITRLEQQAKKLVGQIEAKEKKLANAGFAERAPADIVQKEREALAQLQEQLTSARAGLVELRKQTNSAS
jgi:valyl-tRNA synthetase